MEGQGEALTSSYARKQLGVLHARYWKIARMLLGARYPPHDRSAIPTTLMYGGRGIGGRGDFHGIPLIRVGGRRVSCVFVEPLLFYLQATIVRNPL